LTVLRALVDLLPHESTLYFGDTGRFPYGPKPADEVLKYSHEIADLLADRGVKMLVVACNSATAVALEALQDRYEMPVIGVVEPGVRAAASTTRTGRVGVIGTVGTVASGAYQRAAAAAGIELTCAACPGFVEFVERGETRSDQVTVLAERLLAPVREAKVDALLLGCTHYPFLARTISDVMGRDVVLVDSADETAFEVRHLLEGTALARDPQAGAGTHRWLSSGDVATFQRLGRRLLGPELNQVDAVTW
jgi:glutamate racemase